MEKRLFLLAIVMFVVCLFVYGCSISDDILVTLVVKDVNVPADGLVFSRQQVVKKGQKSPMSGILVGGTIVNDAIDNLLPAQ